MEVLILADNQYKIKSYKIQRTYYKTSKYTLTLFIPPVEALEVQNGYNVNPNAILYLALPWNSETTHKRSIEIRVKNQRSILRKLSEALNWFDSIEDLFVIKDGVLYFNTNYNDLKVKYVSLENSGEQGFKIVPVALERGNNVYEEGVILSINARDNYIELTRDELQELFDILMNFNFANEIQVTYQALLVAIMTGKVGTQQQLYNNKFLRQHKENLL